MPSYACFQPRETPVQAPITVEIRKYNDEDRSKVTQLFVAGICEGFDRTVYPLRYQAMVEWMLSTVQLYDGVPSNGGCLFSAIAENEEVIGSVGINVSDDDKERKRAEIVGMVLAEEHRRKGIGRLMLEFILEYARKELNCESVWLLTTTSLAAACRLFKKNGFEIVNSYREGDLRHNAVDTWLTYSMEKKLV